jgi:cation transport protein ChaC
VHRGTQAHPGLVLGLDRGGACRGVAYRVASANRDAVTAYLRERELVTEVYREVLRPVALMGRAEPVRALAYLVDRHHVQYAGTLPRARLLELVRDSIGISGGNAEYIINTAQHLRAAGIRDDTLEWLAGALQQA